MCKTEKARKEEYAQVSFSLPLKVDTVRWSSCLCGAPLMVDDNQEFYSKYNVSSPVVLVRIFITMAEMKLEHQQKSLKNADSFDTDNILMVLCL